MECCEYDDNDDRENEDEGDVCIGIVCSIHHVVCDT